MSSGPQVIKGSLADIDAYMPAGMTGAGITSPQTDNGAGLVSLRCREARQRPWLCLEASQATASRRIQQWRRATRRSIPIQER